MLLTLSFFEGPDISENGSSSFLFLGILVRCAYDDTTLSVQLSHCHPTPKIVANSPDSGLCTNLRWLGPHNALQQPCLLTQSRPPPVRPVLMQQLCLQLEFLLPMYSVLDSLLHFTKGGKKISKTREKKG